MDFDPESSWLPLEARIASETDPRRRKLLGEDIYMGSQPLQKLRRA